MDEYKEIFMAEATEYLQVLNNCLLKMEKNHGDTESLLEIFRIVHSLKGMAGTMGYEHLAEISHDLENFMEKFKSGVYEVTPEAVDLLFESVDIFQGLIIDPESPGEAAKSAAKLFIKKIAGFQDLMTEVLGEDDESRCHEGDKIAGEATANSEEEVSDSLEIVLDELERETIWAAIRKGEFPFLIKIVLSDYTLMKSVRAYMVIRELEQHGEVITTEPSLQDIEDERFEFSFKVVLVSKTDNSEAFKEALYKIADLEKVESVLLKSILDKEMPEDLPSEEPAKKTAEKVEDDSGGKIQPEKNQVDPTAGRITEKTVRVETAKLDELINLIGEMVIMRNSVTELGLGVSESLDRSLGQLERVVTDLQNVSMKLRMVPIKQVFGRFPRMVRDISREMNKDVILEMSGEETELDRSIINQLSDPLVHLLRNAIDHGIESAEERQAQGKKKEGRISLKAYHESSHVIIIVEDDGGGIDPEKIKEVALRKKVIDEESLSRMSDDDIINLIFYSGFSTSSKVTEVSGRGVGMDAVKKSIELMRGAVEIKSELGKGSTFILRFPLTLAIIKALLVRAGEHILAIPIETVRENVFLEPGQIKTIQKEWVINIRGEVISLHSLGNRLGFPFKKLDEFKEYPAVIIETRKKKAGFLVEELIGQQEIVIKSLGAYLHTMPGIAGATVLGDGRVTLIVDVVNLLDDRRVEGG